MDNLCDPIPLDQKITSANQQAQWKTVYLGVWGLNCANCAARVHNALLGVDGVTFAVVDHRDGMAQVNYDPALVNLSRLLEAVQQAGGDGIHDYRAQVIE